MKKKVLIVAALLSTMLIQAQESGSGDGTVKNKKGNDILPKAGDIALGFNAIPMIDFALNSMSRVGLLGNPAAPINNQAGSVSSYVQGSNNQIVGKYYLNATTAIRGKVGMNTTSGWFKNRVQDAEALYAATLGTAEDIAAASLIRVEDKLTYSKSNILFVGGIEKRRGYRRLQGFYGAEIGIGGTSARHNITYGNAFSDVYNVQYTTNFNTNATANQGPTSGRTVRNLSTKQVGGMRFGVRGFIGVEYFVFSKISVGAEFGWGYSITSTRGVKTTDEVFVNGQNGPSVFQEEVNSGNSNRQRGFSVDNNNGNIFAMNNTIAGGSTALSGGTGAIIILFHF